MASDHPPLHLSLPVVSDSDDRPDLLAFDRALWYAEEEGTLNEGTWIAPSRLQNNREVQIVQLALAKALRQIPG